MKNSNPQQTQAHFYQIHFDILPEITYLNDQFLLNSAIASIGQFPTEVEIKSIQIEEGLDFCQIRFWVFSTSADAIKSFGIWFQAHFRQHEVVKRLEEMVHLSLDDNQELEVILSDWSRILVQPPEVEKAITSAQTLTN